MRTGWGRSRFILTQYLQWPSDSRLDSLSSLSTLQAKRSFDDFPNQKVSGTAQTLREAWQSFVTRSLLILKEKSVKEEMPQIQRLAVRAQEDGALVEDMIVVPAFQDFVEKSKGELSKTTEYDILSTLMKSDSSIAQYIGPLVMTFQGGRSLSL